jgi:hypothetical protein
MPQAGPLRPDDPKRVGRYRLTGRVTGLPAGSHTYLGRTTAGDRVTVTLFASERTPDGAARDRFTAEARAARRVPPFCAARILDSGIEGDRAYLVSEYVPGPLLSEVVAAGWPSEDAELEALAIGMATGLAAVHQAGLVHGEFGPGHVVLGTGGPRVIGFAITPPYGAATPAADMLAWAQTVLFAASGGSPAAAAGLAALPEPLRGMVASCLVPEPAARPAARQVVVRLIGHDSPQAGVLAEGSRRAAKAAMRAPAEPAPGVARPGPARPAGDGPGPSAGSRPPRSACWRSRWPCTSCRTPARDAPRRTQPTGPPRHRRNSPSASPSGGVTVAHRHAPRRGLRDLVGISAAGQRQHRHRRQAQRELDGRHHHLLRHLVYLLGQPHPGVIGGPHPDDEPGNRGRRLPGTA